MLLPLPGEMPQQPKLLSPEAAAALTKAIEEKRRYIPEIVFKAPAYTPVQAGAVAKAVTAAAKAAAEKALAAKPGEPVTVITETGQPVVAVSPLVGTVSLFGHEISKTLLIGIGAAALLYFITRKW